MGRTFVIHPGRARGIQGRREWNASWKVLLVCDMAAAAKGPKRPPSHVVERALNGLRKGSDQVFGDDVSELLWNATPEQRAPFEAEWQRRWDIGDSPWKS